MGKSAIAAEPQDDQPEERAINVALSDIRAEEIAQPRAEMNWIQVQAYARAMEAGAKFPPIVVFRDEEGLLWLADGFHRVEAARRSGKTQIRARVRSGNLRDATLYSTGANDDHGMQRTHADKRRSVLTLLRDPEWYTWSDRKIAEMTRTSHPFVAQVRAALTGNITSEATLESDGQAASSSDSKERKYQTRHGTQATMNTGRIGGKKRQKPEPDPTALQLMADTAAADDPEQIAQLAKLDTETQLEVAGLLHHGQAQNVTHAKRLVHRQTLKVKPWPQGKFRKILADPAWQYRDAGNLRRTADNHYATMSIEDICALDVESLATEDAVLFLWVPEPLLIQYAPRVIEAWGFEHKSGFIWDKGRGNPGNYGTYVQHEHLLICTRGRCRPDTDELVASVQTIPRTEIHSQKPERFREIIDQLWPYGPGVELFSRAPATDTWATWGNEILTGNVTSETGAAAESADPPGPDSISLSGRQAGEGLAEGEVAGDDLELVIDSLEDGREQLALWEQQLDNADRKIAEAQNDPRQAAALEDYQALRARIVTQIVGLEAAVAKLEGRPAPPGAAADPSTRQRQRKPGTGDQAEARGRQRGKSTKSEKPPTRRPGGVKPQGHK